MGFPRSSHRDVAVLSLTRISKHFGPVAALRGVDFSLAPGEVHALLGENGAGKSTLLHIAYGLVAPDQGTIAVRGQTVLLRSPRDARALGMGMVHQHFTSIPELTVGENVALAVGPKGAGRQHRQTGRPDGRWTERLGRLAESLQQGLDPETRVRDLTVAQRQRLEIVKALAAGAGILLLDEPSAVLAPDEVDALFEELRAFARRGGAVAFVTHKLREVFALADRVTVLRQGMVTLHGAGRDQTEAALAEAMIGTTLHDASAEPSAERRAPIAEPPAALISIGTITIGPGELVGIAAIEGQGQRPILRRIAAVAESSGPERVEGSKVPVSVSGRVAFIPEDRVTEGLVPEMSIAENLILGRETDPRWTRGGWLRWSAVREHASRLMGLFQIRAPSPNTPAGHLSGGNQQKLMLGRALEGAPQILVAENPTRGLDIRATADVQERLRRAARAGVAVLVYSTDLDEVLSLADRVLVVREGRVTEAPPGADRHAIGRMMLGVEVRGEQ